MVPLADGQLAAGGGIGPIRRHHEIKTWGTRGQWRAVHASQEHGDGGMSLDALEQQGHQRPMAADPTDGPGWLVGAGMAGGTGWGSKIGGAKVHRTPEGGIEQVQLGEADEMGRQGLPEAESPEQQAARMGEGVGPLTLQQTLPRQGIEQLHPPAGCRQSQGGQSTGGSGTIHPGLQSGSHGKTVGKNPIKKRAPWGGALGG